MAIASCLVDTNILLRMTRRSASALAKSYPLVLGKMIVFITIRVRAAICPRASLFQPQTGTHGNPALASCAWSTCWVTLGEQTRVI